MYTVSTDEKHAIRKQCETLADTQAYVGAQPETCHVWVYIGAEEPLVSGPQPDVAASAELATGAPAPAEKPKRR